MSKMSELDLDRQILDTVREIMGEPETPREIAEHKVAMAVRDAWLATSELVKLKAQDPFARPLIIKAEGDLWSIKTRVDLLLSEIRAEQDGPRLVVANA